MAARKNKWQVKREASREALIRSAVRRFHDQGFAATTVADIVAGTGYSAGAFYFHFADKLECFWQAIAYREQMRLNWATVPFSQEDAAPSLESALRLANANFAKTLEGLNAWVLTMVAFYQQQRDDPDTLARLGAIYSGWHGELTAFVRLLQQRGLARGDRDPAMLARQIFAYGDGLTTHATVYGIEPETVERTLYEGLVSLLEPRGDAPMTSGASAAKTTAR